MTYHDSILDAVGVESEAKRAELATILHKFGSEVVSKISSVNSMLRVKAPTVTGEDVELSVLYITTPNFQNAFKNHMNEVDERKERYSISNSRARLAERYAKSLLGTQAFDRDFTVSFDHLLSFLALYILQNASEDSTKPLVFFKNVVQC